MKRMLLALAVVVLFLNAVAVPNLARADGPGSPGCTDPHQICKP